MAAPTLPPPALRLALLASSLFAAAGPAVRPTPPMTTCAFQPDTDLQPGSLRSVPAASSARCCELCAAEPRCAAAAWNGPQFNTCYLKSPEAKPTPTHGTTACVPTDKPPAPLGPHPPPLPPASRADPCVTLRAGALALCIGARSGRVRSAELGGARTVALSSWAGPIECGAAGAPPPPPASVSTAADGSVVVRQTLCAGSGGGAAPACRSTPPQRGMGIAAGDLRNAQLPAGVPADGCAALCCGTAACTGWVYVPSGPVENGYCTNSSLPCCWLKGSIGPTLVPSAIANISAGLVSSRGLPRLEHPVTVDQTFQVEDPGKGIVRWAVTFNSSSPKVFGSASLGTWLALGAGAPSSSAAALPDATMWAPYGAQAPFSDAGYFEPFAARNVTLTYGVRGGGTETIGAPLAMIAEGDAGVSLALSAEDTIVDLDLTAIQSHATGTTIGFGRLRNRLGAGHAVQSVQYILAHSDDTTTTSSSSSSSSGGGGGGGGGGVLPLDWRSLLGWYVGKSQPWFLPDARSNVESFSGGTGQYCDLRDQNYSTSILKSVGLSVNWDASFAWPWWGNFYPEEASFQRCTCVCATQQAFSA
jgi:hypothetical protein